jgi:hypothetical protein
MKQLLTYARQNERDYKAMVRARPGKAVSKCTQRARHLLQARKRKPQSEKINALN